MYKYHYNFQRLSLMDVYTIIDTGLYKELGLEGGLLYLKVSHIYTSFKYGDKSPKTLRLYCKDEELNLTVNEQDYQVILSDLGYDSTQFKNEGYMTSKIGA